MQCNVQWEHGIVQRSYLHDYTATPSIHPGAVSHVTPNLERIGEALDISYKILPVQCHLFQY